MNDLCKGNIDIFEIKVHIHPKFHKTDMCLSRLYKEFLRNEQSATNGYSWFYFKPVTVLNNLMGLNLCFKDEQLYSAQLYLFIKDLSWENWSEQQEMNRKHAHDKILEDSLKMKPELTQNDPFLMTLYRFDWGEISAVFDSKSGSSLINLRYFSG